MYISGPLHRAPAPPRHEEHVAFLEHRLERTESMLREAFAYAGVPWGFGASGADVFGPGGSFGQPLDDNGLPLIPWVTGTPSDRQWGKLAPIFWTEQQLAQFRSASRWVADTNPFGVGFLDLLEAMHIQKGVGWRTRLRGENPGAPAGGTDGPPAHPLVAASQAVLEEWRILARWVWRSRVGFRRWRRDGDVFFRFFDGKISGGLPAVRWILPERVGEPTGSAYGPRSFGIETDPRDDETPIWYWVRWLDGQMWSWEQVRAGDVLHLKANVDPDVKRGLPDFFPVGADLDRVRSLLTNIGETGKAQAAIAWWEKFTMAIGPQVSSLIEQNRDYAVPKMTAGGQKRENVSKYAPATVVRTDGMRDVTPGPTSVPDGFIAIIQALLRGAGVRWNFPEYFSGDASNQNLASIRESGSPFVRVAEGRQMDWCEGVERPTALRVLKSAEQSGRLPRGTCDRVDVDVEPPAVALSDKMQDENIRSQQYDKGVLSRRTWQVKAGYDPAVEDANIARDRAANPTTPAGGPTPALQTNQLPAFEGLHPGDVLVSRRQYRLLEAIDKSKLVRKVVTDRNGKKVVHWVKPAGDQKPSGGVGGEHDTHVHTVAKALAQPGSMSPADFAISLEHLTVTELQVIKKKVGIASVGGLKKDHIDRLLAHVKDKTPAVPAPPAVQTAKGFAVPEAALHANLSVMYKDWSKPQSHRHVAVTGKPTHEFEQSHPWYGKKVDPNPIGEPGPNRDLPDSTRPPVSDRDTAVFLNNYTWGYDKLMNEALRDTNKPPPGPFGGNDEGKPNKDGPAMFEAMQKVFREAGPIGPPPAKVRRGIKGLSSQKAKEIYDAYLTALKSGEPITMTGFVSTSTSAGFDGPVVFQIRAVHGIDMRPYSHFASENELLLNHGSRFLVTKAEQVGGRYVIHLDQLPPIKKNPTPV